MTIEQQIIKLQDESALRNLVSNYAYLADQKEVEKQAMLFTSEARFEFFDDAKAKKPVQAVKGRDKLPALFASLLNPFKATMHLNGQNTSDIKGDKATGIVYCAVHQLSVKDGKQSVRLLAARYLDTYVKVNNEWFFSKRQLMIDWSEER